jgi:hypothetical protein
MSNQILTQEEQDVFTSIQTQTSNLIHELGEIELIKLQLETRTQEAKLKLTEISNLEQTNNQKLFEKYGNVSINVDSWEVIKID